MDSLTIFRLPSSLDLFVKQTEATDLARPTQRLRNCSSSEMSCRMFPDEFHVLTWCVEGNSRSFAWRQVRSVSLTNEISAGPSIQLDVTSRTGHRRMLVPPGAKFLSDKHLHGVTTLDEHGQSWRPAEKLASGRNLASVSGPSLTCINGRWPVAGQFSFQRANLQVVKAKTVHQKLPMCQLLVDACGGLVLASGIILSA